MTKFMQTVVPDLLAPALGVASGKNFMGSPVVGKLDETKFKAEQGRWKTPEAFKDAALWTRENLGVDMAPEQLKVISDGYFSGPIAWAMDLMIGADADKEAKGLNSIDSPAKWESAIGVSRWRYRSNEAKSVAHAFYAERDKLSGRSRDLNSANPYVKTGKSEDFNSKMARFADAGATPEEIKGFTAMHEYEKTQRKLSQAQAALYTVWKDGGYADNADLTENARQVIESQKEFVMQTRGLN
jgi:heme-degrading monooxygenase HmoA